MSKRSKDCIQKTNVCEVCARAAFLCEFKEVFLVLVEKGKFLDALSMNGQQGLPFKYGTLLSMEWTLTAPNIITAVLQYPQVDLLIKSTTL